VRLAALPTQWPSRAVAHLAGAMWGVTAARVYSSSRVASTRPLSSCGMCQRQSCWSSSSRVQSAALPRLDDGRPGARQRCRGVAATSVRLTTPTAPPQGGRAAKQGPDCLAQRARSSPQKPTGAARRRSVPFRVVRTRARRTLRAASRPRCRDAERLPPGLPLAVAVRRRKAVE
jgi:hypothetical protein